MATFSGANAHRVVYRDDLHRRPAVLAGWERLRHGNLHWVAESFAEAMGVFMYVYAGVGSQAVWVLGNLLKEAGLSSVFQIGLAYAGGIMLAVVVCSATSGGHFNPCITIVHMLFKGFPPLKGLRYIASQIFGGYVACMLIYLQYRTTILEIEAATPAAALAAIQYTPHGPAGIFALYLLPGANIGLAFLNEFVTDFFIALVIFGAVDPSNAFCPPAAAPPVVGVAYAVAIWGFSANGLSANSARDIGGRLAAMTIWGRAATGGAPYAATAALTNIPATILAFIVYELMFVDSARVVPQAHRELHDIHALHRRTGAAVVDADDTDRTSSDSGGQEKAVLGVIERV